VFASRVSIITDELQGDGRDVPLRDAADPEAAAGADPLLRGQVRHAGRRSQLLSAVAFERDGDRADTVAQKPAVISSVLPRCEWKIIRKIIVQ
jgi:hypothetical protein